MSYYKIYKFFSFLNSVKKDKDLWTPLFFAVANGNAMLFRLNLQWFSSRIDNNIELFQLMINSESFMLELPEAKDSQTERLSSI